MRWKLPLLVRAVLVFLLLPIAAIVPLSFSSGSFLTYPLPGWSLRWYEEVLGGGKWLGRWATRCAWAIGHGFVSVLLGTLAALGLARQRGLWAALLKLDAVAHDRAGDPGGGRARTSSWPRCR
jgi:putative spermidine/putrescine transport system permease protein